MNLTNKKLQELTIDELAAVHLSVHGPIHLADGLLHSGISTLVREIRHTRSADNSRIYSPVLGAFALLDQIGTCYSDKTVAAYADANASGIKKALYYFAGMGQNTADVKAVYGLRNALMHDGSLLYRGRFDAKANAWTGPFHHFMFGRTHANLVEHPNQPWDGHLTTLNSSNYTKVNQDKLTDLAIDVLGKARGQLDAGNLNINIQGGPIELYYKYLFHRASSGT
ncbi:hypothetical protein SB861_03090 [Paraburkholderia sp. SIMBA_049]